MEITVNGAEKEIQISPIYTRGVDKGFNEILFRGVKANTNSATSGVDMDLMNIQEANDYLVKAMTGLNDEDIAGMSLVDYNKILGEIDKIKNPGK